LSLTHEEILARARRAVGAPEPEPEEEAPATIIFDDFILADMQSALLKMERRVQEGPGSLSMLDAEELDGELKRIIDEMHRNPHKRLTRSMRIAEVVEDEEPEATEASSQPELVAAATPTPVEPTPAELQTSLKEESNQKPVVDISNDEGPTWDGTGGMGRARGTVNTYAIEGMEEMTAEEYRQALDKSISERTQKRRREGGAGNVSSWNYLNSLGGGTTGALKREGNDVEKQTYKGF